MPPDEPNSETQPLDESVFLQRLAKLQATLQGGVAPEQIGPYRILDILGEGGMGTVYLAEQQKPLHRRVALKVIKLGMDTKRVVARFETEREALALMNHSNVAKVFDAGTTPEGRPYFVMEHVPGIPITDYCDKHRLTTEERLRLFADVCGAVQHAHQKGIIHRDIKPSNVLVTVQADKPIVKVIDFGVAKATQHRLTEQSVFTEQGQLIGTPGYMSPEQAEMSALDIDTRTDIYSLGVLLYELLVGTLPFDRHTLLQAGLNEIQRIIREVDPPRPSTKLTSLGEDSTAIAHKRRTEVRSLARQLRGDLDWIVMKCLEKDRTRRYDSAGGLAAEIQRFLDHEPILAGPPGKVYRLRKWIHRHGRVIAINSSLVVLLIVAILFFLQSRENASLALRQRASALYHEAMTDSASRPDDALRKLEEVISLAPDFLDAPLQRAFILNRENRRDEALAAGQALLAAHPNLGAAHLLMAQLYRNRDAALEEQHRRAGQRFASQDPYLQALALDGEDREAVTLLTKVLEDDGAHVDARLARAWRYFYLTDFPAMLEDARVLAAIRPKSSAAWNLVGLARSRLRELPEAIAAYTHAIKLKPDYAPTYINRSDTYLRDRKLDEAIADCDTAIRLEPDFGMALAQRAWVRLNKGDKEGSHADCDRALSLDPRNPFAWHRLGNWRARYGDLATALEALEKAVQLDPKLIGAWTDLGVVHYRLGRYDESLADVDTALKLDPTDEIIRNSRAIILHRLGRLTEAEAELSKAVELNPRYPEGFHNRARIRRALGRYDDALVDHDRAIELRKNIGAFAARGITYRYNGDEDNALRDFEAITRLAPDRCALYRLWIWEILMLRETPVDQSKAQAQLDSARAKPASDWERAIIAAISGELAPDELASGAKTTGQKYEAWYALGSRALVTKDTAKAREYFQRCIDAGAVDLPEYELAAWHLRPPP